MYYLIFGFFTGLSLILAIGAQNIFVIEQGLKKHYVFLVCLICSISDVILIFLGILIFDLFAIFFSIKIQIILNVLLILFLLYFIWTKLNEKISKINFNHNIKRSLNNVLIKTLGFTYFNPHVYSDTVFFLGNFSKNFNFDEKIYFAIGASFSSIIFFFTLGYLAKYFSKYLQSSNTWKTLNKLIVIFMFYIIFLVLRELITILF